MTSPARRAGAIAALLCLALAPVAQAGRHHITGQVIDRNGEPVHRAIVSLSPGNVQLVTDREGFFLIDYLRDEAGKRVKLTKKITYVVEVFKPGFHTWTASVDYRKGSLTMEPVTLAPETIRVEDQGENLDPGLFGDPTHAAGAHYEGQ